VSWTDWSEKGFAVAGIAAGRLVSRDRVWREKNFKALSLCGHGSLNFVLVPAFLWQYLETLEIAVALSRFYIIYTVLKFFDIGQRLTVFAQQ
jgi:hypothetical protein